MTNIIPHKDPVEKVDAHLEEHRNISNLGKELCHL